MDYLEEILQAAQRIRPFVRETPLLRSAWLSRESGGEVYLKLENLQHTGSFKLRGAFNKLLSLTPAQRARGVAAASSGNHGAALAYALQALNAKGMIYVPADASPAKIAAIRALGQEVDFYGDDCVETEAYARRQAEKQGMIYVSPYNDPQIIGGQGSIAVELARQRDHIDAVFATLGGGGLLSGIGLYLKAVFPEVRLAGCSPANSAVMLDSLAAGSILDLPSLPTLSDGSAGGVEPGAITFDICREVLDDPVKVGENVIAQAMRGVFTHEHLLIEGAAGVAVAAFRERRNDYRGQTVVIILCGANLAPEVLKSVF